MYHDAPLLWKELLESGLRDDDWSWDWSSAGLGSDREPVRARVIAKGEGVWAAAGLLGAVEQLSRGMGGAIEIRSQVRTGDRLKNGQTICEWTGPAPVILALERPFLNLASYAGGIATRTRGLVDQVQARWKELGAQGHPPRVTSTRKTLPGYRDVAVASVIAGGGHPHRISLSGGILIKENHIAATGGIAQAMRSVRECAPHGLKVEIEVRDEKELREATEQGAEIVMLDNFTPERVRGALTELRSVRGTRPLIEVSGGIHEANIAEYVLPGVDLISVGSLTHSVRALDLSMLVGGANAG